MKPELVEKRVYFDPESDTIHFNSDMPRNNGLDYTIVDGKKFIKIDGNDYEISWNWDEKRPEIIVKENDKSVINIPVYMDPISKKWHLSIHNNQQFFNQEEIEIIQKIKVEIGDFVYVPIINDNTKLYGVGHIYLQKGFDDHTHTHTRLGHYIEMNGELVPVKKITNDKQEIIYTIYDLNNPEERGYPVQWEGDRWLFDKKTSIYVADDLNQVINPEQFSTGVYAGMLLAPDSNGLRQRLANGDFYLIIQGKCIRLKKAASEAGVIERYSIRYDDGRLLYVRLKNDGLFHVESFDEWLAFMRSPSAMKPELIEEKVDLEHIYEEIHFNNEMPENHALDYKVIDGKNFINIHGDEHEMLWNWHKNKPEIIVRKRDGHLINIPVYMEPLSKTWHLSMHKNKVFFTKDEIEIIQRVKVNKGDFDYIPVMNGNAKLYGTGQVYVQKEFGDRTHESFMHYIEMNGEIVPVKKITNDKQGVIYKIYDKYNVQKRFYPVQWEGDRWLFDKTTSIYVADDLITSIGKNQFSDSISAGVLSAPNSNGLRQNVENGGFYLIIKGKYIRLEKAASDPGVIERYFIRNDKGVLLYVRLKDDGLFHIEYLKERWQFMHRLVLQGQEETAELTFRTYPPDYSSESRVNSKDMLEITTKGSHRAESVLFPENLFGSFESKNERVISYNEGLKGLTHDQLKAIATWRLIVNSSVRRGYKKGSYEGSPVGRSLNLALSRNVPLNKRQQFIYDNIISGLNSENYPSSSSTTFFRMADYHINKQDSLIKMLDVGDIVTNSRMFMSVSDDTVFINEKALNILEQNKKRVMVIYRIDKASKAKPLFPDSYSKIKYKEEYLYLPETYFKVTGVSYIHSNRNLLTIGVSLEEVVKPDGIITKDIFMGTGAT